MHTRPRLEIVCTGLDRTLEWVGRVVLLAMWTMTALFFVKLPDIIPIHYNAAGDPDGYGAKWTFLILPILATGIYLGLTRLNKSPHLFNYSTDITQENALEHYTRATRMLRFVKVSIVVVFSLVMLLTYFTAAAIMNFFIQE